MRGFPHILPLPSFILFSIKKTIRIKINKIKSKEKIMFSYEN